jgi:hypothetical protein
MAKFPIKITKDNLLKFVTEEQIFERYLGTPVDLSEKYHSPLRKDSHPTCSFTITPSGKLWFKDWAGYFSGDCFNFVEEYYNCDFKEALIHIDNDLNLGVFNQELDRTNISKDSSTIERKAKEKAVVSIKTQPYKLHDLEYWASQGVTPDMLNAYSVFVAKFVRINGKQIWNYTKHNPIYAYILPTGNIKCYRPLEPDKTRKWLSNTSVDDIFGWSQLPEEGELCFITKSLKDIMALRYLGYHSCSPQAEENIFPLDRAVELRGSFKYVVILYDNDDAGLRRASEESERLNIPYIHFPLDIEGKDVSGTINKNGAIKTKQIIENLLTPIWTLY